MRGLAVDHRSDIFSLGIVLWEMVAGQRLFTGATDGETLENVLMRPIAEPSRRRDGVPAALDAMVARALEREPANRYESAEAFANELDRFLVEMPVADQAIPNLLAELASVRAAETRGRGRRSRRRVHHDAAAPRPQAAARDGREPHLSHHPAPASRRAFRCRR